MRMTESAEVRVSMSECDFRVEDLLSLGGTSRVAC